jgi:threonine dehydrogenase-like Zn-dependent dehydrogenase
MRQLVFEGARQVRWVEVSEPRLTGDGGALVRPLAVSTCDMDAAALSGAVRFRAGTPLGHEGVGVVVDVGDEVTRHAAGDLVVIPWQISCGTCPRCARGQDAHCTGVPAGSCYGWGPHVARWGGFLADLVEVPFADHMLVPLPDGVSPAAGAGLGDNLVDAWRAVGPPLAHTGGGRVLVVGSALADGGSIGVYAAAFAVGLGAEAVFASPHAHLRAAAESYGATAVDAVRRELGTFDVTVETSGVPDALSAALRATGPSGVCTCTAGAVHRGRDVPIPVYEMYMNTVTFHTGWVHTRSLMDEPQAHLAGGMFDPLAIASVVELDACVEALAEPFVKLVVVRDA